jgi:RNA polymerase sigma factor (sigma-70 family)
VAINRLNAVVGHLRRVLAPPEGDRELLLRFILRRDEGAFAALVRRHGPMVLGVCRRILRHDQDAEDAFQATFLVLARKARGVRNREAVASWLHAVAFRTAQQVRAAQMRRRTRERQVETLPHTAVQPPEAQDWRPLLDHELNRLPERYRSPLVLCDLHGQPRRRAALQLGLSDGTLSRRLAAGRRLLAERLSRHGVLLSGGALATALAGEASAAVPASWISLTARGATLVAAGQAAALATPAVFLMNQVLRSMLMTKLKFALVLVFALVGAGGIAYRAAGQAPGAEARPVSETELLRREIELLRLRLDLVQQQVRTQQAELQALRATAAAKTQTGGIRYEAVGPLIPQAGQPVTIYRAQEAGKAPLVPGTPVPADRVAGDRFFVRTLPADLSEKLTPFVMEAVRAALQKELAKPEYVRARAVAAIAAKPAPVIPPLPIAPPGATAPPGGRPEAGIRPKDVPSQVAEKLEQALQLLRQAQDEASRARASDELDRILRDLRQQIRKTEESAPRR